MSQDPSQHGGDSPRPRQAADADEPMHNGKPSDHFRSAVQQLAELRSYGQYWLNARLDVLKISVRNLVIYAILGVVAAIVGLGVLVATGAMLVYGLIHTVAAIPHVPFWAAALLVPMAILLLMGVGGWLVIRKVFADSRRALQRKYERDRSRQRADFGHDVQQRAASRPQTSD